MEKEVKTYFGKCFIEKKGEITSHFYSDHYRKIRVAKGETELKKHSYNPSKDGLIENHYLAPSFGHGKKFIDDDGKYIYIQGVYRHWDRGYYDVLLTYSITDNGKLSHGTRFYENINSSINYVQKYVDENKHLVFIDSTLKEKLDIMISNRKLLELDNIYHINSIDLDDIETIDIPTHPDINSLIAEHKKNLKPLFLSGGLSWVMYKYPNFSTEVIKLENFTEESYGINYINRKFEI